MAEGGDFLINALMKNLLDCVKTISHDNHDWWVESVVRLARRKTIRVCNTRFSLAAAGWKGVKRIARWSGSRAAEEDRCQPLPSF